MLPKHSEEKHEEKRILVTGGLGFVGFHLCEALLDTFPNCELSIVDNLSSTKLDYTSLVGRADIHIKDLRSYNSKGTKFDEIYHLASPVGSLKILENHGHVASDILELAHIASDLAARDSASLLYLSSSEVYGRDGQHNESADQIVPSRRGTRMEYALGKLTAEHVLLNLADNSEHIIRIIRPFNVVGRHQSNELGFVVPEFFKAALEGRPLLVHGDGKQTRSFCSVDDLILGLMAVQSAGQQSTIYNVGNPDNKTTILNLANNIKALCKSSSEIKLIDPTEYYGRHYLEAYNKMPDIAKMKLHTGWTPVLNLQEILVNLLDYYSRQSANASCEHVAHVNASGHTVSKSVV